jgi:predicted dehydrogenase
MLSNLSRRRFLSTTLAAGAALSVSGLKRCHSASEPSNRVTLGLMGLNQGSKLAKAAASLPNIRVKYLCDVDRDRLAHCRRDMDQAFGGAPECVEDFRRILDDPEVDALVCAAPNHWHAAATILACDAGKHVYVEKPCSHNAAEGELMIAAARTHNRVVQVGLNRRSSPQVQSAIQMLRDGRIGDVHSARAAYSNGRPSIGVGRQVEVPATLDYDLWQGPAPRRPYVDNVIPYNWHWFWHWGNGELGNNGVHALDVCRWGLGAADLPEFVTAAGGRYHYEDDQETPDTSTATFTFSEGRVITWQGWSCNKHRLGGGFATFFGSTGALDMSFGGGFKVFDADDNVIHEVADDWGLGLKEHIANFVSAIRDQSPDQAHCDIVEGHRSTMFSHLGNIAMRTRRALHCDPETGRILEDADAMQLWGREYEPGWAPQV